MAAPSAILPDKILVTCSRAVMIHIRIRNYETDEYNSFSFRMGDDSILELVAAAAAAEEEEQEFCNYLSSDS
jgi:hypothetical protein